jgi:hypothetical protein
MNLVWSLPALLQGLVAGIATIVVLAIRAAIGGASGLTFADLWTALAVGIAVGVVSFAVPKLAAWQIRRATGLGTGHPMAPSAFASEAGPRIADEPRTRASGGTDRFDRFTDHARRVLTLAQDEAQRFDHSYISTEHMLLGLLRETDGTAALVLANLDVEPAKVRRAVEFIVGRGDRPVVGEVGLTSGGKRVIELAIDEARSLAHRYIGSEHLLLGLVLRQREDAPRTIGEPIEAIHATRRSRPRFVRDARTGFARERRGRHRVPPAQAGRPPDLPRRELREGERDESHGDPDSQRRPQIGERQARRAIDGRADRENHQGRDAGDKALDERGQRPGEVHAASLRAGDADPAGDAGASQPRTRRRAVAVADPGPATHWAHLPLRTTLCRSDHRADRRTARFGLIRQPAERMNANNGAVGTSRRLGPS